MFWAALDDAMSKTYASSDGTELHIAAACIDSGGHHTQIVYDYCRQRTARRIFAVKGVAGAGAPGSSNSAGGLLAKQSGW